MHADQFGDSSIWYKWTAPSDGPVDFNTAGSTFNTLLGIYTLENGYFHTVASNDDDSPSATWSKAHFDGVANKTYYIAVDGFLGAAGDLSLGWNHTPLRAEPATARITAICAGSHPDCDGKNFPADVCTADSDPAYCPKVNGFTLLTVKGVNFTTNSQVIMRADILNGSFDKEGKQPTSGNTRFIDSNTLVAEIPPYPQLSGQDLASTQVLTHLSSATTGAAQIEAIPPGTYSLAANTALLNVIELRNATIPANSNQTVCGNVPGVNKRGEETCLSLNNESPGPITVTPTWFAISTYCKASTNSNDARTQCLGYGGGPERLTQLMHNAFAINPQQAITNGSITVLQNFPVDAALAKAISLGGVALVAQGGGNLVASGGGNLVASGGGNLVAQGGGNLVASGGGNLVASGGGNLVAQGGGNVVSHDGGSLVAQGGGNLTHPDDLFVTPANSPPLLTASELQNGSRGWFIASSSGGQAPTVTTTTNLDGTVTGTLSVTFNNTSNPRVSDLQGIAFTVVANPAVVQFASNNVTVDEGAGRAIVTVNRTGDTSMPSRLITRRAMAPPTSGQTILRPLES